MSLHPTAQIAATARVHPDAQIGKGVIVGEYAVIEQDVTIGAQTRIEPYVYIKRWTLLGERNEISAGTVLGSDPLDKHFTGERSYLVIGNGNKIREHYTISRGTAPESSTINGDGNYIMTSGHIAHNAKIGNNTVIASCALISGYVEVEDQAFISGSLGVQQYCRIGRLAMVGGGTRVNVDVPPYFLYAGLYVTPMGLNLVGLKRAGIRGDDVKALKTAYRLLYRSGMHLGEALDRIDAEVPTDHTRHLTGFIRANIRSGKRGIARA